MQRVDLPDGGRFDFAGHEKVGLRGIGFSEFLPDNENDEYYIESSRYFYRGFRATSEHFYTAFTIPQRPPTGAPVTGLVSNMKGEISIVELSNASAMDVVGELKIFDVAGNQQNGGQSGILIPTKGSRHIVITESLLAANSIGSAEVTGPPESITSLSLVYRFDEKGELTLANAPSFSESAGIVQFTDFNSFIGNVNKLRLRNSSDQSIMAMVTAIDYLADVVPGLNGFPVNIPSRGTTVFELPLPSDTYGTLVVDSGGLKGLVVRNDVERPNEYILSFPGR
jgi:hypothetical protein